MRVNGYSEEELLQYREGSLVDDKEDLKGRKGGGEL